MLAEAAPARDIADALAELKARRVAARHPDGWCSGPTRCWSATAGSSTSRATWRRRARSCGCCADAEPRAAVGGGGLRGRAAGLAARRPGATCACGRSATPFSTATSPRRAPALLDDRRRLPARGRRSAALRPGRGRPSSPSSACRCSSFSAFLRTRGTVPRMSAAPPLAGVIGWPIGHSLLAAAARALAARATASPATTSRSALPPEDFAAGLLSLARLGFRGIERDHPAQGGGARAGDDGVERARARDRGGQHADLRPGRQHPRRQYRRLRLHRQPAAARRPAGARRPGRRWCSAPAGRRGRSSPRCSRRARRRSASPTGRRPRRRRWPRISARGVVGRGVGGRRGRGCATRRRSSTPRRSAWRRRRAADAPGGAPGGALVADVVYGAQPTAFLAEAAALRARRPSTASACCCTRRSRASSAGSGGGPRSTPRCAPRCSAHDAAVPARADRLGRHGQVDDRGALRRGRRAGLGRRRRGASPLCRRAGPARRRSPIWCPRRSATARVDRERLRAAVAADPRLLARIEARVHPLVAADRAAFVGGACRRRSRALRHPAALRDRRRALARRGARRHRAGGGAAGAGAGAAGDDRGDARAASWRGRCRTPRSARGRISSSRPTGGSRRRAPTS